MHLISIHAPTRGATDTPPKREKTFSISIHAPTRGATLLLLHPFHKYKFQSTLPRGERHMKYIKEKTYKDFNPRSHEGSDQVPPEVKSAITISIHAPTRGATLSNALDAFRKGISIHAPTRGATGMSYTDPVKQEFQSTLPRGERHNTCYRLLPPSSISIHAPTRGATKFSSPPKDKQ